MSVETQSRLLQLDPVVIVDKTVFTQAADVTDRHSSGTPTVTAVYSSGSSAPSSDDEDVEDLFEAVSAVVPVHDDANECIICRAEIKAVVPCRLLSHTSRYSCRTLAVCLQQLLSNQLNLPSDSISTDSCVCGSCERLLQYADNMQCQLECVKRRLLVSLYDGRGKLIDTLSPGLSSDHLSVVPSCLSQTRQCSQSDREQFASSESKCENSENHCSLCSLNFHDRRSYLRHMLSKHPSRKFSMPAKKRAVRRQPSKLELPTTFVDFDSADSLRADLQYLVTHVAPPINASRQLQLEDVRNISHLISEEDRTHLAANVSTECNKCGLVMQSTEELENHLKWGHRKEFSCRGCLQDFNTRMEVKQHKAECKASMEVFRPRECPKCGKFVKQMKQHLRRHRFKDSLRRSSKSSLAADNTDNDSQFGVSSGALGRKPAQRSVSGGTCSVCNKYIARRLQRHEDAHYRRGQTQCPICRKQFSRHDVRDAHIKRVHIRERNFVCGQCGKSFVSLYSMQRHQMLHTGSFRYYCRQCYAGFRQKTQLVVHMKRRHNFIDVEESDYVDETNTAAVTENGAVDDTTRPNVYGSSSVLDLNSSDLRFMCQECGAGFSQRRALTTHMRRMHGIENVVFEDVQLRVAGDSVDPSLLTVDDGVAVGSVVLASSAEHATAAVFMAAPDVVEQQQESAVEQAAQYHPADSGNSSGHAVFVSMDQHYDGGQPEVFSANSNECAVASAEIPAQQQHEQLSAEQAVQMVQETTVVTTEQWW